MPLFMIDRTSDMPIKRQIYQTLKERILTGQLKAGEALPSTRGTAQELSVSRHTVCEAYDMLIAEGFLESRQGAPTRVAAGLCIEPPPKDTGQTPPKPKRTWRTDFQTGRPDLSLFPWFAFEQLLHEAAARMPVSRLGYGDPQGLPELRGEISAWLLRSRGLTADAEDIFITAGATHALHIAASLPEETELTIQVEDPCHSGMLQTFLDKGYRAKAIPVDMHGMQTEFLDTAAPGPVYVTPSHQFPLGGILSASRRAALIRYARENDTYIVEDDYDSEFRYSGDPVSPLYAMDPQRVIYVGTFSKVLFPALRIGYVILPRMFHERWCHLRTYTDVQNPPFEQAALAAFLQTRKMDRHVQKMRKIYGQRRRILLDSLNEAFGGAWRPWGDAAGLHLAAEFPGMVFDAAFSDAAVRQGIRVVPAAYHCIEKGRHLDKLLIGYGHLQPQEIQSGIERLTKLFEMSLRC